MRSWLYQQTKRHDELKKKILRLLKDEKHSELMSVWRAYIYEECALLLTQPSDDAESQCYLRIGMLIPIYLPQILIWLKDASLRKQDVRFVYHFCLISTLFLIWVFTTNFNSNDIFYQISAYKCTVMYRELFTLNY